MDPLAGGIWALALAVFSAMVLWFFKGPKEVNKEVSKRVDDLEDAHHNLNVRFSVAEVRLTEEIKNLAKTITELSLTIKRMDERRNSGRQPRI